MQRRKNHPKLCLNECLLGTICLRRSLLYSITAESDSKETEDPANQIPSLPCIPRTSHGLPDVISAGLHLQDGDGVWSLLSPGEVVGPRFCEKHLRRSLWILVPIVCCQQATKASHACLVPPHLPDPHTSQTFHLSQVIRLCQVLQPYNVNFQNDSMLHSPIHVVQVGSVDGLAGLSPQVDQVSRVNLCGETPEQAQLLSACLAQNIRQAGHLWCPYDEVAVDFGSYRILELMNYKVPPVNPLDPLYLDVESHIKPFSLHDSPPDYFDPKVWQVTPPLGAQLGEDAWQNQLWCDPEEAIEGAHLVHESISPHCLGRMEEVPQYFKTLSS